MLGPTRPLLADPSPHGISRNRGIPHSLEGDGVPYCHGTYILSSSLSPLLSFSLPLPDAYPWTQLLQQWPPRRLKSRRLNQHLPLRWRWHFCLLLPPPPLPCLLSDCGAAAYCCS